MLNANLVSMPIDPNILIKPNLEGNEGSQSNYYAKILRELQFLTNSSRPNIAYAVNKLSSYSANPSPQHVGALKQILKGIKILGKYIHQILRINYEKIIYSMAMWMPCMLIWMIINQHLDMYFL